MVFKKVKDGIFFIPKVDKRYPQLLREIPDPPRGLYAVGDLSTLQRSKKIAVVGTRKMTEYGKEVTEKLTSDLVKAGYIIVSGMAIGVDAIAHRTAITSGGKTIAVLGCGIDTIYPSVNRQLYFDILKHGSIVSEFPAKTRTTIEQFVSRNRIISGMSLGVVITEGALKSGTMITASYAAEQGREVFCVPGPITSSMSLGTSALIQKGAKLVTNVSDILAELPVSP